MKRLLTMFCAAALLATPVVVSTATAAHAATYAHCYEGLNQAGDSGDMFTDFTSANPVTLGYSFIKKTGGEVCDGSVTNENLYVLRQGGHDIMAFDFVGGDFLLNGTSTGFGSIAYAIAHTTAGHQKITFSTGEEGIVTCCQLAGGSPIMKKANAADLLDELEGLCTGSAPHQCPVGP